MSIKRLIIGLCACIFTIQAEGQKSITDSVYTIKGIDIYGSRLEDFGVGASVQRFDSTSLKTHRTESISELISLSGVNIKANGVGGLSSLMLRGGGSSHTAIIWNGLNIQSPMSGSTNLSIFPVNMFNSVKLQYGGSGTLFGSGAVAGVVHLSSGNLFNTPNSISVTLGRGSANSRNGSLNLKFGNSKIASSFKVSLLESDNDYEFHNTTKFHNPKERISNAGTSQVGFVGDVMLRLSEATSWSLSGWYQNSDQDIQTQMSNTIPNSSNQKDNQFYTSSNLKFKKKELALSLKNGLLFGKIIYADPTINLKTNNHFNSFINELEGRYSIASNQEFLGGLNYTHEVAYSGDYTNKNAQRDRASIFSSYKISLLENRLKSVFSVREEIVDHNAAPIVFSIGSDYQFLKNLTIKGNFSRNYKLPTLNDLYWANTQFAEGNPDLKPESGWSGEMGLVHLFSSKGIRVENSITLFRTYINDWIVWLPTVINNISKWKPFNVDLGKTYGAEVKSSILVSLHKVSFLMNGFYSYTHSRMYSNESNKGEPMIYTPKDKFSGSFSVKYSDLSIQYAHTFNGERLIDYASPPLPYYNLGDFSIGYDRKFKSFKAELDFKVHNVWNTDYQLTASYAMPLRYYSLALTVDINTKY